MRCRHRHRPSLNPAHSPSQTPIPWFIASRRPNIQLPFKFIRNLHLTASPFIGAFVYSDALRSNETFLGLIQWGVFPLVAAAGLALWLRPRLARRDATQHTPR